MSYTPKSPEGREIIRRGLTDLVQCIQPWLIASVKVEDRPFTWPHDVSQLINELNARAHEADARAHWGATTVEKCPSCHGQGFVVICAGDGEWSDSCERCEGTGFVPTSFDPHD